MPTKVCVVTGTRADYGLLQPVISAFAHDAAFDLQIIASGMHLSPEFGLTYREIEDDGFVIDAKVEMLLSSDSGVGVAKAIGLGTIGFADAFVRLEPDLILLLGDRFEALAAAQTALVMRIPIAHLSGGDVTSGVFDDAIRHSISKMAHLHFVASGDAARRVRQLGEDPARIFTVGDPGLDRLRTMRLLDRAELERALEFRFRPKNLLVTFHPVTLDPTPSTQQFAALLDALDRLGPEVGLLLTKPNADPEGRALIDMVEVFCTKHANARAYVSLGHQRYLSVMKEVDAVVGNSSSGLLEAPSVGKPSVNIGNRQDGRLKANSVVDCPAETDAIATAIEDAFGRDCRDTVNPYGDGRSAERIVAQLKRIGDPRTLVEKRFYDVQTVDG